MENKGFLYDLESYGTVAKDQWERTKDIKNLKVRGPDYLTTRKKVECTEPLFEFIANDLFKTKKRYDHVLSHPQNRVAKALSANEDIPFIFAINFQVPGPPFYSYLVYFACDRRSLFGEEDAECIMDTIEQKSDGSGEIDIPESDNENEPSCKSKSQLTAFQQLCTDFFLGEDDKFRDNRFKMIPRIVSAPFIVKSAVPSNKPAVLGNRLTHRYFRGPNYLELCIDIGSNAIARNVTRIAIGGSKRMVVDIFILLEGKKIEELPEQLLTLFRAHKLDISLAVPLEEPQVI